MRIMIRNVQVKNDLLSAEIELPQRSVCQLSISSSEGRLLHKLFVQLDIGENTVRLPFRIAEKGRYVLSLLMGAEVTQEPFAL